MLDPEIMSPGTLMPPYPWMMDNEIDTASTKAKIEAMITLGVPYEEGFSAQANAHLMKQANGIAENLKKDGIEVEPNKDIIALIAYLQRLGTDIKAKNQYNNNEKKKTC